MNPFLQSLITLVISVLLGGKSWTDAIQEWLKGLIATGMTHEEIVGKLNAMSMGVGCDCDNDIDEHATVCASSDPGKFGDGSILKFLKTIDWAKFAQFIMTIIAVIPKNETSPGPVA